MAELVEADWVEAGLGTGGFTLVDPRLRLHYLSGHARGAIHAPVRKAFGPDGRLLPEERLAAWLGSVGIGTERPAVVYDQYDGQYAATLAWLLDYLGHPDVRVLRAPFSEWAAEGRELFYRPVEAEPAAFELSLRPELRARLDDVAGDRSSVLLDVRSPEEFSGDLAVGDDRPGHLPGAVNVPWLEFVSEHGDLYRTDADLVRRLGRAGITPDRRTIVYCRSGPRAAAAVLTLRQLGYPAALYDASFAEWSRHDHLPVEA